MLACIGVKFIFDSVRLGLSSSADILQIGSLRIDDFRTTTPLGHVIVLRRRHLEIWIYDFK